MLHQIKNKALFLLFFLLGAAFVLKALAGDRSDVNGLSDSRLLIANEVAADNCQSMVFKIPKKEYKRFFDNKDEQLNLLLKSSKLNGFERWKSTPVVDFGMTVRSKLVYLSCDFGSKQFDSDYKNKLNSEGGVYTFSQDERVFILFDTKSGIVFYKYQGV